MTVVDRSHDLTPEALEVVSRRFKALADSSRLTVLHELMNGERTVAVLADQVGLPISTVSRHLQRLLRAGFVRRRKTGVQVWYRIADAQVQLLCDVMCGRLDMEVTRSARGFRSAPRSRRVAVP